MKIRIDFITNSSSAAFIVQIDNLTCKQRTMLMNIEADSEWSILDTYPVIFGSTTMDNFGMEEYLKDNGFPMRKIHFYYSNDASENSTYLKSLKTCDCKWCKMLRELDI